MFEKVDFDQDIESILLRMEHNCQTSKLVRTQIEELKINPETPVVESFFVPSNKMIPKNKACGKEEDGEYLQSLIARYHAAEASLEEIVDILPDLQDFSYRDVILRLYAESLRDIKEMMEMSFEDGNHIDEDASDFIEEEKAKIDILSALLSPDKEELEEISSHNKIILSPSVSGKIRAIEDLDRIPIDYYPEISELLESIVNGTFKRFKKIKRYRKANSFQSCSSGGVCEVRGSKGRILFQRLAEDTYAVFAIFLKKTTNDKAYQEFLKLRIGEFVNLLDFLKEHMNDPEFMKMNDDNFQEFEKILGGNTDSKCFKKEKGEV